MSFAATIPRIPLPPLACVQVVPTLLSESGTIAHRIDYQALA